MATKKQKKEQEALAAMFSQSRTGDASTFEGQPLYIASGATDNWSQKEDAKVTSDPTTQYVASASRPAAVDGYEWSYAGTQQIGHPTANHPNVGGQSDAPAPTSVWEKRAIAAAAPIAPAIPTVSPSPAAAVAAAATNSMVAAASPIPAAAIFNLADYSSPSPIGASPIGASLSGATGASPIGASSNGASSNGASSSPYSFGGGGASSFTPNIRPTLFDDWARSRRANDGSANGTSTSTGTSAYGASATGTSATGTSATGTSATGTSANGTSSAPHYGAAPAAGESGDPVRRFAGSRRFRQQLASFAGVPGPSPLSP